MNPANIIQVATDLQANSNKNEIVQMARALGWKGDHARAPVLQLALYVATKLAAGERGDDGQGQRRASDGDGAPHEGSAQAPQGQQQQQQQQQDQQQQQQQQSKEAEQADSDYSNHQAEQDKPDSDWEKYVKQQQEGQQQQQGQGQAPQGQQQDQQAGNEPQGQQQQQQQQQDQQDQQQQDQQQQDDEPEAPAPDEYQTLLKASGIQAPHRLLHKVWLLTSKAKQNVLLVGPAGSGKTMLAAQLGQLLRVPFGSISCTMGMSESQLTGWLLPVGQDGAFSYVPAPFITCLQQPSVFLLDELDAADPNVLMLGNSVWSNGFISIPHKTDGNMVQRHADAIIIAGANTCGTGADDLYSARAALDGSTVDRFYPVVVDYDEAYEHGLFNIGRKSRKQSPAWFPSAVPDQFGFDALRKWFFDLRSKTKSAKLNKIISSRLAQRLVASVKVGIPVDEAKKDLLLGWTADELTRVGER